jgi:valyl-tRNA synthetase
MDAQAHKTGTKNQPTEGEEMLMTAEMPKNFNFAEAEARLYAWWEAAGYFKPEVAEADAQPFVIAIPPPNVTGELHLGHAMFVSIEDLMIRYERMRGKAALWIPGTDHAGIATQLMVERLLVTEGTSRQQVGRDEFTRRTWEWKEKYGGAIINQLRRLGASCDWERLRFTLDESLSKAVRESFVRLWEQGLIYRGTRLINWSPGLQTAVSDLEVEYSDEQATLYYFKYLIDGMDGEYVPVATIRPETILGDTAVAVHPEDERYQRFIGKQAIVPMLGRKIPVIADEYVEREFGTGGLKVTPAHDFNDYKLAQKHNLPMINILNKDASLNENAGPYAGLDRYDGRKKLWADMAAAGLTLKTEAYQTSLPRSQRGGEIVEPMLSTQWFVKMEDIAAKAVKAVRDGRIKFVPERFEKVYFHWLENIEDWCISRQLWWGHRIPVWYDADGGIHVFREGPPADRADFVQDPDVLDTWFSSGLWPFSTLGWPAETPDLLRFYPTDVLETGYDILFFWVARMIMMGLWFTDEAPFHTVYLHGLVRDKNGDKMSKTKGNVIDPLETMEKFSTDALRFTLITGGTPGNDQNISEERIEYGRNFGNKLWQMSRFVITNLGADFTYTPPDPAQIATLGVSAQWTLSRLHSLITSAQRLFDTHQYGEAGRQIKDFLWEEFADWTVEISKDALYGQEAAAKHATLNMLLHVIDTALRLLHPFMPFITEDIWSYLPSSLTAGKPLIISAWPVSNPAFINATAEAQMDTIRDLVVKIRNVRLEYSVDPSKRIAALVGGMDGAGSIARVVAAHPAIFARLCNVERLTPLMNGDTPQNAAAVVSGETTLYLPLAGLVDFAAERERLLKELENVRAQIEKAEKTLGNESFVSRAKPDVVQRERDKLTDLLATRASVEERLKVLPA